MNKNRNEELKSEFQVEDTIIIIDIRKINYEIISKPSLTEWIIWYTVESRREIYYLEI